MVIPPALTCSTPIVRANVVLPEPARPVSAMISASLVVTMQTSPIVSITTGSSARARMALTSSGHRTCGAGPTGRSGLHVLQRDVVDLLLGPQRFLACLLVRPACRGSALHHRDERRDPLLHSRRRLRQLVQHASEVGALAAGVTLDERTRLLVALDSSARTSSTVIESPFASMFWIAPKTSCAFQEPKSVTARPGNCASNDGNRTNVAMAWSSAGSGKRLPGVASPRMGGDRSRAPADRQSVGHGAFGFPTVRASRQSRRSPSR